MNMHILYEIAEYGPILLFFLSLYLLFNNKILLIFYTFGIILNSILNKLLKNTIQQHRPLYNNKTLQLKQDTLKYSLPFDLFGMPSGHAQMVFFTTVFVYLSAANAKLFYLYLIFSLFICYQRVAFGYHSTTQVIVGATVGTIFAYFIYYLYQVYKNKNKSNNYIN